MKRKMVEEGYMKKDWPDRIRWENNYPYQQLHVCLYKFPFDKVFPDIARWVKRVLPKRKRSSDDVHVRVTIEDI